MLGAGKLTGELEKVSQQRGLHFAELTVICGRKKAVVCADFPESDRRRAAVDNVRYIVDKLLWRRSQGWCRSRGEVVNRR